MVTNYEETPMGPTSSRFTVAVHILALLAIEAKDRPTTSDYLARSARTNPVVIRRILAQLGNANLLIAQPGTHGGVKLARPAAQINLREVYQAVEKGAIFSFGSRENNPHCICGRSLEPVMTKVFHHAEQALEDALAQMTVAELAAEVEAVDAERH
jgi:Rrf2 family protein